MTWTTFEAAGGSIGGWHRGVGSDLVLVLHGGPGLSDYTEGLADEVHTATGRAGHVVRYQQRGIAPSTLEGPFTVAQLVDDLFAVVDHFGAAEAMLVGHSWGGHLAMHAACARPERVSGLVLVDTLGAIGDGGAGTMNAVIGARVGPEALRRREEIAASGTRSIETVSAMLALAWPGYFADPATAPPAPPMICDPVVFDGVIADAVALLADGVLERALPLLSIPSVHLFGSESPIDPAATRATADLVRDAHVRELPTGHFIWIEQPGAVASAVEQLRERY